MSLLIQEPQFEALSRKNGRPFSGMRIPCHYCGVTPYKHGVITHANGTIIQRWRCPGCRMTWDRIVVEKGGAQNEGSAR